MFLLPALVCVYNFASFFSCGHPHCVYWRHTGMRRPNYRRPVKMQPLHATFQTKYYFIQHMAYEILIKTYPDIPYRLAFNRIGIVHFARKVRLLHFSFWLLSDLLSEKLMVKNSILSGKFGLGELNNMGQRKPINRSNRLAPKWNVSINIFKPSTFFERNFTCERILSNNKTGRWWTFFAWSFIFAAETDAIFDYISRSYRLIFVLFIFFSSVQIVAKSIANTTRLRFEENSCIDEYQKLVDFLESYHLNGGHYNMIWPFYRSTRLRSPSFFASQFRRGFFFSFDSCRLPIVCVRSFVHKWHIEHDIQGHSMFPSKNDNSMEWNRLNQRRILFIWSRNHFSVEIRISRDSFFLSLTISCKKKW